MGYAHIENLYKDQTILMFKECYALEKIHGTSSHITWDVTEKKIKFFAGGEDHQNFVELFDEEDLKAKFAESFTTSNVIIYGETYGGKQQGMSKTYGDQLKFIAFDVRIGFLWLNVPSAERICKSLGLEFVDYEKISTDLSAIDAQRDKDSTQAIRNGCGPGKIREGVVLRTLVELRTNNNRRIIAKHKRPEYCETKTPREVNLEALKVIEDAREAADEWVTINRIKNIFSHLSYEEKNILNMSNILKLVLEDIKREGESEIIFTKVLNKEICKRAAVIIKEIISGKMG